MQKSKIFLFLCLSFIIGIFLASYLNIPKIIIPCIAISGIILIICWKSQKNAIILGFCLIVLTLGIIRYRMIINDKIQNINIDSTTDIIGIIIDEPDTRTDHVKLTIETENSPSLLKTKILISTEKFPKYQYGDKLQIKGKIQEPIIFPDFNYKQYLARFGIKYVIYYPKIQILSRNHGNMLKRGLLRLKFKFENIINQILPEPHASFLGGLLLGAKRGIPEDLMNNFNITGTTHIVAISGYNITIIAVLLIGMFNALAISRKYSFWLIILTISAFVVLTGASSSVVRAAIMGILVLTAGKFSRVSSITNALIFTGMIMIAINPYILRFDAGFQLSFLATMGLIYVMPLLEKLFKWLPEKFSIRESLLATIAAQITAVPLIIYQFGRLSLIAPLTNLLILPLIPATMLVGFLSAIIGFIWIPAAEWLAWPAWLFLIYEIKIVEWLAKIPYADVKIPSLHWIWVMGYYIMLIIIITLIKKKGFKNATI